MTDSNGSNSKPRSQVRRVFSGLWTGFVVLYRCIFVLVVVAVIAVIGSAMRGSGPTIVEDNVALVWHPIGEIVEDRDRDPTSEFFADLAGEGPISTPLHVLVDSLDSAADDSRVRMAVLWLDALTYAGPAQLEEMKSAIQRFKSSGKRVVAYAPGYSQRTYYLAAQADEIIADPMGMVMLEGYAAYNNYYPELLEKLGINVHVFQAGDYKTAVEPFTRSDMSAEAKEANLEWLDTLWTGYRNDVVAARELDAGAVDSYVSSLPALLEAQNGDAAAVAMQAGLIDSLKTREQFREQIAGTVGWDDDDMTFRQIDAVTYAGSVLPKIKTGERVGVVTVQGTITQGESDEGIAGSQTIAGLLREARDDDDIKALVLRVNSPGGGIYASEEIRRGVQEVQSKGKPVVVSMSTLAASGGYWISADAEKIFAHDTTITGSIGVFGMFPTFEGSLDKIGVTTDGVGTTPLAGAFRVDRPLAEPVKRSIDLIIQHDYRLFVDLVAEGREMEFDAVNDIAQGRVWSGADALERGLVDEIGSFGDAVAAARGFAELDADAPVQWLRPTTSFDLGFLSFLTGQVSLDDIAARAVRGAAADALPDPLAALLNDGEGSAIAAHCLCAPAGVSPATAALTRSTTAGGTGRL